MTKGAYNHVRVILEDEARGDVFTAEAIVPEAMVGSGAAMSFSEDALVKQLKDYLLYNVEDAPRAARYVTVPAAVPTPKPKPTKKRKPPKCVLCGTTDEQYPEWGETPCSHTKKERKGD